MRSRRQFLASTTASLLALLSVPCAGQVRPRARVSVLMGVANDEEGRSRIQVLRRSLAELGWTEGDNFDFDVRWSGADSELARRFAREIVASNPSVIIANSTLSTVAVRSETQIVPIVFVQLGLSDPIALELTDSIARPTKNITGFLNFEAGIVSKWLQMITEVAPGTRRVGAIASHRNFASGSSGALYFDLLARDARAFSFEVQPIVLKHASEIKEAIGAFAKSGNVSLVVLADIFNTVNKSEIIAAANEASVPAIYPYSYFTRSGGLLSYGVDLTALYKGAATYADRILRGAKVADLPIQMPSKFTLSVNLPAAKRLGITIPASLLMQADETIE